MAMVHTYQGRALLPKAKVPEAQASFMARIVMKFGGTSMAGIERIRHVAGLVRKEAGAGNEVAVVVSAMAGETDRLVQFCREASSLYDPREYDVVVASGEQVTSGLLAITLQGMGLNARSYMGWQLPIRASGHASALIDDIEPTVLERVFAEGGIAVIPGFQGVAADGSLATLGRGGSDTSAVALAAAVEADRCDIYTDVDGVYTTDPRIVPRARKLAVVTFEEMLELASVGAKVLQTRSVGLAMRHRIRLQVLSSFEDRPGTLIVGEDQIGELGMERQVITGIAYDKNEARVTLTGVPAGPGTAAAIFGALAEAGVNYDMIVQSARTAGERTDIAFTVPAASLAHAGEALERKRSEIGFEEILTDGEVCKVSIVGVGIRTNPELAARMFATLAERKIDMLAVTASEIKVSVLIPVDYTELAVRVLHTAFGLDAQDEEG
jgi:aspartate kinase